MSRTLTESVTLYYVRVVKNDICAYKIGVTTQPLHYRFGADYEFITVLKTWEFNNRFKATKREKFILDSFRDDSLRGCMLLNTGGNTELFSRDVLGLDTWNS